MDRRDIAQLLARVVAYDNRKVDEMTITAWCEALADVELVDAEPAVVDHYRGSDRWIMPVHVRGLSVKYRNERRIREAEAVARRELAGSPDLVYLSELARVQPRAWLEWPDFVQDQAIEA